MWNNQYLLDKLPNTQMFREFFFYRVQEYGTITYHTMPRRAREQSSFHPAVSRGILAIVLLIIAIIITLSFFDQAGPLGYILNTGVLSFLFGSLRFLTPAVIVIIAGFLIKDMEYDYRPTHGIGAFLFFLTAASLLHIGFHPEDMWDKAVNGLGGGAFGMLAWPLKTYLGSIASIVLLVGLVIVSLLLMFNTAILHLLAVHKKFTSKLGTVGKEIFAAAEIKPSHAKNTDTPNTANEDAYDSDDAEEEVNDDEEETLSAEQKRRGFTNRSSSGTTEESEEDVSEDADDTNTPEPAGAGPWAQKVIIKELPPIDLLTSKKSKPTSGDIKSNAQIIQDTFGEFNIAVDMGEVRVGPTITQYTVKPHKGIKVSRITGLTNDLALALAAHPVRIEAPIPGKSLIGIEVPNEKTAMVTVKELLESEEFTKRQHSMMIGLGKDVAGKIWFADLPRMPHLLIAGATGSGKTVCVNTIILSLLYQNTAETLRMIMVDPKRVELTLYNGIPHLLTPVITNTQKTINALKWTIGEMDRRFELLSQAGNRDIQTYNERHPDTKIPYLVFIIDELADLMATAAGDVEGGIIRLAQMARAVGIHLIVATQRPSVDVITGLMKANIPARIAFSVASAIDSRTILDSPGAEQLLGRGDMLFSTAALSKPVRIQGAFISEDELKGVVDYLKGDEIPEYDESIVEKSSGGTINMFGGPTDGQDPLFEEAKQSIILAGKASASFLQRKLKVGYARAARLLDELEAAGIIGPADGAKPREILVTETEIDDTMDGDMSDSTDSDEEDEIIPGDDEDSETHSR